MYELFVVCRRRPPEPPGGFEALPDEPGVEEVPVDIPWLMRHGAYLPIKAVAAFRAHRTEAGSESAMVSLAQAIADAGDGVVLSRAPVTLPWQFDLEHEGREPPADWAALVARAEHYREGTR